uniref:Perlucin-like n=1 Tax=Crassostrea virginica TaxID=6565 RepID=A0A8B8B1V9_CRAVI|nr:perlucin-like [Crassostrea virginica]
MIFSFVITIVICFGLVPGQPETVCPHGWIHGISGNSCYAIIRDALDYFEATAYCTAVHSKLLEIENASEEMFLRLHLLDNHLNIDFWIGLNDILTEGEFVWMSTQQIPTYTDWGPNQPDNDQQLEDCVLLSAGRNFQWNDRSCTIRSPFICEKEMGGSINVIG